ncbi:MAG: flagella basal body P-ring formation protein FlgA [Myxococcota bacterium]
MDLAPPEPALLASLAAYATERCAATRVEVRWLGLDPARLPAGGRPSWEGDPCRPHPTLSLWWSVGGDADRFTVRPDLVVWVSAPVASTPADAGDEVVPIAGVAPLDRLAGGVWTGGPAVAIRALRAGEPLTGTSVRARADVASGAALVVRVRSGDLQIHADGRSIEDGRVGQPIRVYLLATDVVVRGVLTTPTTVDL